MSRTKAGRPTTIADKGPAAAPTTATLSGEEQHAFLTYTDHPATRALHAAAVAVENHIGARTGPDYEAKQTAWRHRYAEWRTAMRATPPGETA